MNATRLLAASILLLPFTAQAQKQDTRTPVLVELFTSEGCSSCPPADALLAKLEQQPIAGAEIIVLGEHVDYWDQLGWRDRFSSHQYTDRQGQYSTHFHLNDVYTPQMVVNGQAQFVGNDSQSARSAIVRAAHEKTLPLALTGFKLDGKQLSASIGLESPATGMRGDVYAALVSPMETTQVRAGENGGRTLNHVGVVRSLTRIGDLQSLQRGPLAFTLETVQAAHPLRLVIFAQAEGAGTILGAVSTPVVPGASRETVALAHEPR